MKKMTQAAIAASMLLATACGLPFNQLSSDERKADMEWAFTIFNRNYAPAQLKKSNFGVEMSQVEADCVTMSEDEMTNQEFLALFQRCIHNFKDAHVGAQQMNSGMLPEYAQVAHLGFVTMRTKAVYEGEKVDALKVMAPLKGSEGPGAPLVVGDVILQVNGMTVKDYLKEELFPYLDVGQDETTLTNAGFRFSVRTSVDMALPAREDVELKVARGSMLFDITLPWITEDMLAFQLKQQPPEEAGAQGDDLIPDLPEMPEHPGIPENPLAQHFFGFDQIKSVLQMMDSPVAMIADRVKFIAQTGFRMMKFNPIMNSIFTNSFEDALTLRSFPMSAKVTDLMTDPTMFAAKAVKTEDGQVYAYLQITSFPAEDKVLEEWYRAITAIEDKQIKSVVIDMIDNGGGSLIHGMRMLNMLRQKPLEYPSMQLRLNDNWMNSFRTQAAFAPDDYGKAIARGVLSKLEADKASGKLLSRPLNVKVLDPFFLQNPTIGLSSDVKVALLVNEMCVSMCDIFASVFQDNDMGLVIGQRTMGGGGNVTQHGLSPAAKIGMALTESLVISASGKFLEDNGVTPDVQIDMVSGRENGFEEAFTKAYDHIFAQPTP